MGRAKSTKDQDVVALKLFDYFLAEIMRMSPIDDMDLTQLSDELEDILTGYLLYLCSTNIPKNHVNYLSNRDTPTREYMKYTGLTEYLGKVIQMLKKVVPDSEFWEDKEAI